MRAVVLAVLALAFTVGPAQAQRDLRSITDVAVRTWNARSTTRVTGAYDVDAGQTVPGTVAVLNGPIVLRGAITGSLVAINADVRLETGARIDGDLIVVGGTVNRDEGVTVRGEIRSQVELLRYRMDGELMVAEESVWDDWRPQMRRGMSDRDGYTDLFFVAARTYNRTEGLPIAIGPRFLRRTDWGRISVEALGVVRTAEPVRWDRGTLGHDARAELRVGRDYGLVFGARAFDVIQPIEDWQLQNVEAGLASFLLHRDLRDHYGRHGGEGTIGGRIGEEVSLHAVFGTERWRSVDDRRPFSLLRNDEPWRANPGIDEGTVDLLGLRFNVDTRERTRSPWTGGWYVKADLERGRGTIARALELSSSATPTPEDVNYTRGFIDARRYTRVSPGTELNFRVVMGGQLGGDRLPLQRRFSIGGPGSVEGYDFRRSPYDDDVFTCGGIATFEGRATLCDRMALGQVELRQDFHIGWVRTDHNDDWWRPGFNGRGQWVVFADAGRGWTVNSGAAEIRHDKGVPPLNTFRTSLGLGVDFGDIGFYFAKALTTGREPVNFLVRLGRRF
ncbi:MAG: BamA/TamA family outer membrane protein [Gemmatimonadaceae bacterium]|nr:BamA/TamA family outer membrane protein [Gemmatimonadaceae bacterium]